MGYILSLQPTFTQGFVLGQLSILILVALVLKYFFLVSQSSPAHHLPTIVPARSPKYENTKFEVNPENSEWLNLILREVVQTYRSELRDNRTGSEGDELARARVERQLNNLRPTSFVGPITVHSVNLGSSAPRLHNPRIDAIEGSPDLRVELDMTYTDTASISLSTFVLFNYPLPYFARLPVSLTLSLSMFSSKIILTPPSSTPTFTLTLPPDFTLDLHIKSLLGSRAKLADVPKLHDMIESQIKRTLADRGTWTIVLPSLTQPLGDIDGNEIDVKFKGGPTRQQNDMD